MHYNVPDHRASPKLDSSPWPIRNESSILDLWNKHQKTIWWPWTRATFCSLKKGTPSSAVNIFRLLRKYTIFQIWLFRHCTSKKYSPLRMQSMHRTCIHTINTFKWIKHYFALMANEHFANIYYCNCTDILETRLLAIGLPPFDLKRTNFTSFLTWNSFKSYNDDSQSDMRHCSLSHVLLRKIIL